MTRDDIIRMAREAGAMFEHMAWVERDLFPVFTRFAELVAAAEREACAKVAETMLRHYTQAVTGVPQAIRARGERNGLS